MKKDFLSNAGLMMGVNLLIKPLWIFAIDRTVQNILGPEAYGHYAALFSFSMILAVLLDLGINNYTTTQVARHPDRISDLISATLSAKIAFSFLYVLVTITAAFVTGYNGQSVLLLACIMCGQILSFFHTYFRAHFSGLHRFKTDSFLSASDRLIMMALAIGVIWGGFIHLTVYWWIAIQVIGYACAALISFALLKPHIGKIRLIWQYDLLKEITRASFPYALLALIMTAYMRSDTILLQRMLPDGNYENGIYAQGYRLLEAGNMMIALISAILLPMFSRMFAKKENVNPLIDLSIRLMILPGIFITICSIEFRNELMHVLYKEGGNYSAEVFAKIICCFLPFTIMYLFGTLLTAHGSLKKLNVLASIALLISLTGNWIFIPQYKAYGAALTAIATNGFIAVSNAFFAYRIKGIQLNVKLWLKMGAFGLISWFVCKLLHDSINSWQWAFLLSICSAGLSIFVLRMLSIQEILQTFRRKA